MARVATTSAARSSIVRQMPQRASEQDSAGGARCSTARLQAKSRGVASPRSGQISFDSMQIARSACEASSESPSLARPAGYTGPDQQDKNRLYVTTLETALSCLMSGLLAWSIRLQ